jgi:hypothetical protein
MEALAKAEMQVPSAFGLKERTTGYEHTPLARSITLSSLVVSFSPWFPVAFHGGISEWVAYPRC